MSGFFAGVIGAAVGPSITVPGAPTITGVMWSSSSAINVTFSAPSSNGGATITKYTAVSSPGSFTNTISSSTGGTINISGLTSGSAYTFTVYATNSVGNGASSSPSASITVPGQVLFCTTGSHTWTVPSGVTRVSVVAVGGGGGYYTDGSLNKFAGGGGGGALAYGNCIAVTPGATVNLSVGVAGTTTTANGGATWFCSSSVLQAGGGGTSTHYTSSNLLYGGGGGGAGGYSGAGGAGGGSSTHSYQGGCGGTASGSALSGGGSGGAGGWAGSGSSVAGSNGSGGGGGGGGSSSSGGGGGVGVYGQGCSGAGAATEYGGAGSGGCGTSYGGGKEASYLGSTTAGHGALRLIWGICRSFPSTNTGNV